LAPLSAEPLILIKNFVASCSTSSVACLLITQIWFTFTLLLQVFDLLFHVLHYIIFIFLMFMEGKLCCVRQANIQGLPLQYVVISIEKYLFWISRQKLWKLWINYYSFQERSFKCSDSIKRNSKYLSHNRCMESNVMLNIGNNTSCVFYMQRSFTPSIKRILLWGRYYK